MAKPIIDKRFTDLGNVLADYALGKFDSKADISDRLDEVDTIISGVNMLGEELKSTTISRNFFMNIYDSVSEMLFVLDGDGLITDTNRSAEEKLKYPNNEFRGKSISHFLSSEYRSTFNIRKIKASNAVTEVTFITGEGRVMPVELTANRITDRFASFKGIIVVGKDITERKELDRKLLRAVVQAQESERERVAYDLHDSLGQELSALKIMLGNVRMGVLGKCDDPVIRNSLSSSVEILDGSIRNLRNICFNLLPATLENGNIFDALKELKTRFDQYGIIQIDLRAKPFTPLPAKHIELSVFRVIQEFINNAMKHGKAGKVEISLKKVQQQLVLDLKDNGSGFEIEKVLNNKGRGLVSMQSRVRAYEGKIKFASSPGKGTHMNVIFPL